MTPFYSDNLATLYQGDVREVLAEMPDESVHCAITSPPYWGLRDYGTASWEGGDPECEHVQRIMHGTGRSTLRTDGRPHPGLHESDKTANQTIPYRDVCGKCGAVRIDNQLGLEPTPELYIEHMVEVFRAVRRVLRSDGTCWVNMGDCYATGAGSGREMGGKCFGKQNPVIDGASYPQNQPNRMRLEGLKPKDLVGMPWRLAFALQAVGVDDCHGSLPGGAFRDVSEGAGEAVHIGGDEREGRLPEMSSSLGSCGGEGGTTT